MKKLCNILGCNTCYEKDSSYEKDTFAISMLVFAILMAAAWLVVIILKFIHFIRSTSYLG